MIARVRATYFFGFFALVFRMSSGFQCTFDKDTCGFTQSTKNQFDWIRKSGAIPKTGPTGDHTSGNGYYMYVTSLNGSSAGIQQNLAISEDSYLSFFYYINGNGSDPGTLEVYIDNLRIWRSSKTGLSWNEAKIIMNFTGTRRVVFQGTVGAMFDGVVAMDDIFLVSKEDKHKENCELFRFGSQCELGVSMAIGVVILAFAFFLIVICFIAVCLCCCCRRTTTSNRA